MILQRCDTPILNSNQAIMRQNNFILLLMANKRYSLIIKTEDFLWSSNYRILPLFIAKFSLVLNVIPFKMINYIHPLIIRENSNSCTYLAGAFLLIWDPIEGKSSNTVFSICVSSSNCSAPTVDMGLHLYRNWINFGINELEGNET